MDKIEAIGINFGDNDFHNTFLPLLDSLNLDLLEGMTKRQIATIINELVYGMYLAHQNLFQYDTDNDEHNHFLKTKYLQVREDQILLNSEVTKLLEKDCWQNGEFFYRYKYGSTQSA